MTCHVGQDIIVCDGQSGGWRVTFVSCPFCCLEGRKTRHLSVVIFGGYGGQDFICGECGQRGSSEGGLWKTTEEDREKNIARVAAQADPKCWECHDTGSLAMPWDDPDTQKPCSCEAGGERK